MKQMVYFQNGVKYVAQWHSILNNAQEQTKDQYF